MYIRSIASTSWWIKLTIFSAVFTKYVQHSHWTISRKYPEIVLNVQCLMSFPKSVLGQESTYFVICAWIKLPICTRIQVFTTKEGMEKLFSSMHILFWCGHYMISGYITFFVDCVKLKDQIQTRSPSLNRKKPGPTPAPPKLQLPVVTWRRSVDLCHCGTPIDHQCWQGLSGYHEKAPPLPI